MMHVLDHPIWNALSANHRHLAIGDDRALRYQPDISPFVATADDDARSLAELAGLVAADETVVIVRKAPIALSPDLVATNAARALQMVAERPLDPPGDARLERLGPDDERQIYDLAILTRPGPFARHTMRLGEFWGVKQGGRLVAMAGERLRQGNWTELSGVCVHPDARGQGLARLLSAHVTARIAARGERPYLHCFETNAPAIALYESLGYATREVMNVTVATRRS